MQETIEQILDYLKGIWVKRRYIIVSTWLICPISWLFISQLDDTYESTATVYADTQSILRPLLKGMTVETNPDNQIRTMVRTLLSRPNIERITRMTDLDLQAETPREYEKLIKRLEEDIVIRKTGGLRENIFKISFNDKNAEMAKSVVDSVVNVFIENTIGENRTDTDSAQKFLSNQLKEYENRLLADEARLTDFKQKYSEVLPNQYGGFYTKLNSAKEQLKSIELVLSETESQLENAKAQLNSSAVTNTDKVQNKIKDSNSIVTSYDQRISELEAQLDSLLLKYTDKHPTVIESRKMLTHLISLRTKEVEEYLAVDTDNSSTTRLSQNPVIQNLQIQVNQLEGVVAATVVRRENYQNTVQELENKIHVLPEIEAELVALNRGYEITKTQYEKLLSRKDTAQIAKDADETTSKINFKIIDPARAPNDPTGPKRILLLIASTILGVGIGIGLSLLFSQLNPVVTSASQVSRATGIPVFGAISATENLGLQQWHKKKTIIFVISHTFLLGLLCCFILYSLFPEAVKAPFKGIL